MEAFKEDMKLTYSLKVEWRLDIKTDRYQVKQRGKQCNVCFRDNQRNRSPVWSLLHTGESLDVRIVG